MDYRLIINPEKSCDTIIINGNNETAVSFYFKPADIINPALAAALKQRIIIPTISFEII
jgi:hypothetical protein